MPKGRCSIATAEQPVVGQVPAGSPVRSALARTARCALCPLEVIREDAEMSVARLVTLLGMPRATWYRWRAAVGADRPAKGPWPAPVVDAIEPLAAKHAEAFDAWGYRKIWGLLRADGILASQSSVRRALGRRGLLQPVGYQAERRQLATERRAAFLDPPARRNRIWQTDFSELESLAGGIWRRCTGRHQPDSPGEAHNRTACFSRTLSGLLVMVGV